MRTDVSLEQWLAFRIVSERESQLDAAPITLKDMELAGYWESA